jgi:hypothetical protein
MIEWLAKLSSLPSSASAKDLQRMHLGCRHCHRSSLVLCNFEEMVYLFPKTRDWKLHS